MNTILGMKTNKQVEQLIKGRVLLTKKPYEFKVTGVTGFGYDTAYSAHSTYEKLCKWAKREGAEIKLIKDEFKNILENEINERNSFQQVSDKYRSKGQSKGYLIIEITDPCARIIEYIIK